MKEKNQIMLTIAFMLILIAGFAYATYQYILPAIGDFNLSGSGAGSTAATSFVIYYADGSQQVIEAPNKLEVYSATLVTGGREIMGIGVSTKLKLDTGGRTVSSWSSTISRRMEIYKAGVSTPLSSSTANYPSSGSSWANGEEKIVGQSVITSAQIEAAINQYSGTGTYTIQVVDNVQLQVSCSDGSQQTLTGTGVASLTIEYRNYNAMSITVTSVITPMNSPVY